MNYNSLHQKSHFLEIKARSLAEGMKSGSFRSLYRGQGIEMSAVRDYIRGDDIRAIDWNVTARMGKPYVKLFEEHRELLIFLIIDSSLSMQIKEKDCPSKYDAASEAAALLTFAAELNECPIGTVIFDGKINLALLPLWGREQTMIILSNLEKHNIQNNYIPEEQGSVLDSAISGAGKLLKKRSLVFIFSDFRTTDYEKNLGMLAHKNDVIAVRMTDEKDDALPMAGTFPFVDAESGIKKIYPASSQKFRKAWKKSEEAREKTFVDFCIKHGIMPVAMKSTEEPLKVLSDIFNRNIKK